jgi:acyl-CoA thioesterase-1
MLKYNRKSSIRAFVRPIIKGFYPCIVYLCLIFLVSCSGGASSEKEVRQEPQTPLQENQDNSIKTKRIIFFGNSLTAGYGLSEEESFTSLIQSMLDSLQLPFQAVNAGLSGETTAGGDRRIEWVLKQQMDVFFLELGGNDMLRGTDVRTTEANLRSIIQKVRNKHQDIPIILAGMMAPPNLGKEYTDAFGNIYRNLAKEYNLTLIPFFLEGVAGVDSLNQSDGIHPTAKGQEILAETVWSYLYPLLK